MSNSPKPPSTLRRVSVKVLAIVGAVTVGFLGLMVFVSAVRCASSPGVPDELVLELDLDRPLGESGSGDPLAGLVGSSPPTVRSVVDTLDRAAEDERVVGLIAYIGGSSSGLARTQEIRDAVGRFRASGKFAVAFGESYGEFGSANQSYMLATAFDEVWLQPSGGVGLTGLMSSSMFVKGSLEMLDVEVHGDKRREYKNAFNMYTERRYTEAHAEATKALLDDFQQQIIGAISEGRGLSRELVWGYVQEGPFVAPEALDRGLVDKLGYRDEAIAAAKARATEGAELLYAHKYRERIESEEGGDAKIALVYGVGGVMRGPSSTDPLSGSQTMGSDTVAAAIRAAVADEDVEAIVFRVDSPGGSPVASDVIWRETIRARDAGKPVIVSMGNVAGSGGYYVAAGAAKIVAQPGTITGSIGVFAGKPNLRKLWNKVGVTYDSTSTAPNAEMFSQLHGYDEQARARLDVSLDQIYIDFKTKVAEGRGMSVEDVEKIAKGRVWSGARAKEIGLVDELGGLRRAVEVARTEAGIDADASVRVVEYPAPKGLIEQLLSSDEADNSESNRAAVQAEVMTGLERWQPVLRQLEQVGLGPNGPATPLTMMPIELNP